MKLFLSVVVLLIALARPVLAAAPTGTLNLGVYPYLSPSQIVEQFAPLGDHLARTLGRPVNLVSAPDFEKFIERTRAGEYDIIFTAPHMGRLAEKRDGYRPVAQTAHRIQVALICRKEAPLHGLADLKGRSIAIGARLSMTYQLVERTLQSGGMSLDREVRPILTASFSNVMEATLRGEADVGAIPTAVLINVPVEQRDAVREILRTEATPGALVLAHPRHDNALLERIREAFLAVRAHPEGQRFLERSKLGDFQPLDAATMKRIDPFTAVLERK